MTSELLFPAAFLAGFVGSTHCLGMCGAIVLLFEQEPSRAMQPWVRRMLYNLGRGTFYVLLGGIAGAASAVIVATAGARTALMVLRLVAGLLVVAIGINLVFNWNGTQFLERAGAHIWRRIAPLARHVLPIDSPARAMAAGFLWGALPCGLVYSAVAMAATAGSMSAGALVMAMFWLGTLPALLLAGTSAQKLHQLTRHSGFRRVAGVTMIVIGVLAMAPIRMHIH